MPRDYLRRPAEQPRRRLSVPREQYVKIFRDCVEEGKVLPPSQRIADVGEHADDFISTDPPPPLEPFTCYGELEDRMRLAGKIL